MHLKQVISIVCSILFGMGLNSQESKEVIHDFEIALGFEYRYFPHSGQFQNQEDHFPSLSIQPEYAIDWNNGSESLNMKVFFRLDVDDSRTHWDIRELYYQKAKNNWELNVGLRKVYWGVTESNHLVDIINQTDAVESFDGEQKLGQPMVQFSFLTNRLGTFKFFYMPFHRKRTFPGEKGRLRFPIVIDKNDVGYESGAKEWRQDLAFRWNHYFGAFDIGISHFFGNGREPLFIFNPDETFNIFYPVINQTGLDLQATHNGFLWKLESIYRSSNYQDFFALTAGLEFTISNIGGHGLDLGLLGEYLYDDRDELALNALQNDVFFGTRLAFNDTQDSSILIGGISDLELGSRIFSLEASRRLGSSWTAEIEGRIFSNVSPSELILSNFREDSFFRISVLKYF